MGNYPIRVTRHVLVRAPISSVWRCVSNTDALNRAIGTGAVEFFPTQTQSAARYLGRTTIAGIHLEYHEAPFEWEHERRFSVKRTMKAGPLHEYRFGCEVLPGSAPDETQVELFFEATSKTRIFAPIGHFLARGFLASMEGYVRTSESNLAPRSASVALPPQGSTPLPAYKLDALTKHGVSEAMRASLAELLAQGSDAELAKIRPYAWAREHGFDRRATLSCMLHAVNAGLLELRWALICPSCVVPSSVVTSLDKIEPPGHCQFCDISFDLELDKAVEALFVPHPSVRPYDARPFCIGGPSRTPHVLSQGVLSKRTPITFHAPSEEGRFRIFARGGVTCSVEIARTSPKVASLVVDAHKTTPGALTVAPGGKLEVSTTRDDEFHVKFERLAYASDAASAYEISNLPEFRRHFSSELLKSSTPLKVARVSLLFSDLTGSTALYSEVGDAGAFRFVDDHFDVLRSKIENHGGVIVKTMGDAVMASFLDDETALQAAREALIAFDTLAKERGYDDRVGLKLGIFSGPCYVVTANGTLDYFGQTANVAARLQGLAHSGEIIMLHDVYAKMRHRGLKVSETFTTKVKGVSEDLRVERLVLSE